MTKTCRSNRPRLPFSRRQPEPPRSAAPAPAAAHKGLPPDAFARIRTAVTTQSCAERYGIRVVRGLCSCPFHSERTPSLKIYPGEDGWYCFGCGKGGDVIDFAAALFGLSKADAARRLDEDFGLGITDRKTDRRAVEAWKQKQAEAQQKEEAYRNYYDSLAEESRQLRRLPPPTSPEDFYTGLYARAQGRLEYLDYFFELTKEEVIAWLNR